MNEFIEKLIGRLNERMECLDNKHKILTDSGMFRNADRIADRMTEVDLAKRIVNQLAEEYKSFGNSEQVNNAWIPCSERLPELTEGTECFKQSPVCLTTLKWWDGDMTESVGWYNQSGAWNEDSKNCKVVAWQPLPEPYQPKGE